MDNKIFKEHYPTILGLCGKAGSGKTSTANVLAPKAQVMIVDEDKPLPVQWDHLFYAMPLYELASVRRTIKGESVQDRVLFETHRILYDLFGGGPLYGTPPYDDFIKFVHEIATIPIAMNEEIKPRPYLQTVGTMCRDVDPDCFVKWVRKTINIRYASARDRDIDYICIVSDIRMANEAKMIVDSPNGVVIRFDASDEVRHKRLFDRDGFVISEEQSSHVSEQIELIPAEYINHIMDTDELSLEDQAKNTKELLYKTLEGITYA